MLDRNRTLGVLLTLCLGLGSAFGPLCDAAGGAGSSAAAPEIRGAATLVRLAARPPGRPAAPSSLVVADLGNGSDTQLTWVDNSGNETGFRIDRQQLVSGTWQQTVTYSLGANVTAFTNSPGPGTFHYHICAVNAAGRSQYTGWVSVVVAGSTPPPPPPPPSPPNAPSSPTASDLGNCRAMFAWADNSDNETVFELERTPPFPLGTVRVGANVTGYVDQCGPGSFSYHVRAVNAAGASAFTGWAPVTVAEIPPAAPSSLRTFDMGNGRDARLSWSDNSNNETEFRVERQTSTGVNTWGPSAFLAVGADSTGLLDAPGLGTHQYRVAATNDAGDSAWTAWASVTITTGAGWTVFTPSADTLIAYVSSSEGNDANDGMSEATPKRTILAGYGLIRDGYPDWLLLKSGDAWNEVFPGWRKSGRSSSEKMVVGAYGSGTARPVVNAGTSDAGFSSCAQSASLLHFAMVGVKIDAPSGSACNGVQVFPGVAAADILFEDVYVSHFNVNVVVQQNQGARVNGVTFRRCVIVDAAATFGGGHSEGLFCDTTDNLTIDQCTFDHNGFDDGAAVPTVFNHSIYVHETCGPATVTNNIVVNSASHGVQLRSGGTLDNNILVRNAIGLLFGGGDVPVPGGVSGTVRGNIVLAGKDIDASNPRGFGIELKNVIGATVSGNIVANRASTIDGLFAIGSSVSGGPLGVGVQNTSITNNIVYNWRGGLRMNPQTYLANSVSGNRFIEPTVPSTQAVLSDLPNGGANFTFANNHWYCGRTADNWFSVTLALRTRTQWVSASGETGADFSSPLLAAPTIGLATYAGTIGLPATEAALVAALRAQSRGTWRADLQPDAIAAYLRAGFTIPQP